MSKQDQAKNRSKIVIERTYRARIEDVWDLWTTKQGFESWWGPQGFRAEISVLEARVGGLLHYEMIADTPEMVAAMKAAGQPVSHPTHSSFAELKRHERLVIRNVIDFLPGVTPYEADIAVDFIVTGPSVRMVVALDALHSDEMSKMQREGMASQLSKLDTRFA
jgi:uncharacterized protein YndB with AHSA1/START domain